MPQRKLLYLTTSGVGILLIGLIMVSLKTYDFSVQNRRLKDKITLEKSIHQNQISEILERYDSLNATFTRHKHSHNHSHSHKELPLVSDFTPVPLPKKLYKPTAKTLKAININARGVRLIGDDVMETTVSSKIDQVRIRFTLEENKDLQPGTKDIFVQVRNPKDRLLRLKGHSETKLVKQVHYDRLNTDVCLFLELYQHQLIMGDYKINLICDGAIIGSTNFRVN